MHLPDFSPQSQDQIALRQIAECKAFEDINLGNFESAVNKCSRIWASLPGAKYGQHVNNMTDLKKVYLASGGALIQ
jgi:muramidase (phage lysozyme)